MKTLVTKLSGVINNPSLLHLGEMRIKIDKVDNPTKFTNSIKLGFEKDTEVKIIGEGFFTDSSLSQNLGKTLTCKTNEETIIFVSITKDVELAIMDKYSLFSIKTYSSTVDDWSNLSNIHINIKDLAFSKRLKVIHLTLTDTYGDIVNISNNKSLLNVVLNSTNVHGDISTLSSLSKNKVLELNYCTNVHGDIKSFANNTTLTSFQAINTNISGDISAFSNCSNLTNLSIESTGVRGDISRLKTLSNLHSLRVNYDNMGDLSQILQNKGVVVLNGGSFSWTNRPQSNSILAINGYAKTSDVDKMLQDQANCESKITESSSTTEKTISVLGNRTSESDDAIQTLQEKGFTVVITPYSK